jgi:4-carboxymuconolactone decarboxylase
VSDLPSPYKNFQEEHPYLFEAYEVLGETAAKTGPLDRKTRELVKLGMAAAYGSESAVHSHVHRAMETGASWEEIEQTILLGITTLGFPTMMAALTWAKSARDSHQE